VNQDKSRSADLSNVYRVLDPGVEDRAALHLAQAIHRAESSATVISWSAQERAQDFYNHHGLSKTLDITYDLDPTYHNERGITKTLNRIAEMLKGDA
jgi:hypothetical protein